jgi:hypothetical protein
VAEIVAIVFLVLLVWLLAFGLLAALTIRHAGRANRVAAGVRSPAPLRWRWSGSSSARLHRRLQAAVWPIDPTRDHPELPRAVGTDDLRAELVAAAVRTDAGLAEARRAPSRVRRATVRAASARVSTIEELAARLQSQPPPARWPRPSPRPGPTGALPTSGDLDGLTERVECLEVGRAEVAGVEGWVAGRPVVSPPRLSTR